MSLQAFNAFVKAALERQGMPVLRLDQVTGDRVAHVLQGRQKPPLATLHRWAAALHLSDADRDQLFALADAAHGGNTIAGWIVERLREAEADHAALRRQIARAVASTPTKPTLEPSATPDKTPEPRRVPSPDEVMAATRRLARRNRDDARTAAQDQAPTEAKAGPQPSDSGTHGVPPAAAR